jgi:hypothetical protein
MASLSLKGKTLILAVVVAATALVLVPTIGYAGEGEPVQKQAEKMVALRARGIAVEKIDEERTVTPTKMGLLIQLGEPNQGRIPIQVLRGRVKIGEDLCNITGGKGVVLLWRQIALIRCEALDPDGESVVFKFAIRYRRVAQDVFALRIAGVLKTEGNRVFMRLRGLAKLLP